MEEKVDRGNSSKKRRNANFSREEVHTLVVEYGKRLNALNFGNREQKHTCWEEITSAINSLHDGFHRSVEEIKKKWIDLLYATKKEYVKATKDAAEAGEPTRRKLSEISELIVKVRGGFSDKRGKSKNSNGVHIISLGIPGEGSEQPTTIYIPHVDDFHADGADIDNDTDNSTGAVVIPSTNIGNVQVTQGDAVIESVMGGYESYNQNLGLPPSPPQSSRCSCGLSADLIRLKQETLGVLRRKIQIEEERRIEEKQKWWEEKQILRLKRQKLELEIKQLQKTVPPSAPMTPQTTS